jgi:DNA polymerase III epsilon subunit family exonuclease
MVVQQAGTTQHEGAAYPGLVERALACIAEHHGSLDENALIGHVFGGASSAALWRPLLRSVLANQPGLTLRADGVWTTRVQVDQVEFPAEFVVLDVETTGLKPTQQRVIEVALVRVSPHGAPIRWSSLVNPGRPIPAYISQKIGIRDAMVADAPEFRSIAPTIVEIIEELPVVGHNVGFDLSFINMELMRCGLPRLVNTPVDTLTLTSRLVPEARRLNLADVAKAMGIDARQAHRAMSDAETTLEVFRLLLMRAREQGLSTLDDLLRTSASARPSSRVRKPVGRASSILDRSHLTTIPHAPGVYIMRDKDDRVLYVGKAKDLRKRVGSYYSQPLGYTRKMDGLLETLDHIQIEVVGSELEALILESQLIRRYRPRYNTVQRNAEQYVYVKVDVSNPWPRVTTCRDRAEDGARYFGPFKSSSRARDAVELVNTVLPLRTCRRSFADKRSYGSPCLELELKHCLGPCVGRADPEEYRGLVRDVVAFFEGDTTRMIVRLHGKLQETVTTLDFERAARLRDRIRQVERLAHEQHLLDGAGRYQHALLVLPSTEPDEREVWYLLKGRRWAQLTVADAETPVSLADRLEPISQRARQGAAAFVPDHHAVDELSILARWMRRTPEHPALIGLDDRDLLDAARLVMNVDVTTPFGDVLVVDDSDDESEPHESAESEIGIAGGS